MNSGISAFPLIFIKIFVKNYVTLKACLQNVNVFDEFLQHVQQILEFNSWSGTSFSPVWCQLFWFYRQFEMALFPECPLFQGSSVLYRHDENMKYVCSYQLQHLLLSLFLIAIIPLSTNPTSWSNILKQFISNLPTNCLSVFDHFVGLVPRGFTSYIYAATTGSSIFNDSFQLY